MIVKAISNVLKARTVRKKILFEEEKTAIKG
jgi:hypothetical protein